MAALSVSFTSLALTPLNVLTERTERTDRTDRILHDLGIGDQRKLYTVYCQVESQGDLTIVPWGNLPPAHHHRRPLR